MQKQQTFNKEARLTINEPILEHIPVSFRLQRTVTSTVIAEFSMSARRNFDNRPLHDILDETIDKVAESYRDAIRMMKKP